MNNTLRRIAVSGSAAVALLGGVAAITVADSDTATAAEIQTRIDRATGAPVNLPDGRTMHVRGLDTAAYKANPGHYTATVSLASAKTDTQPGSNDLSPQGGVTELQNPVTGQVPAGYNQQIQTQAGGGAIAVGGVALLLLVVIAFFRLKKHDTKVADAVIFSFLGVAASGTVFGVLAKTLTEQGVGSLGGILGSL